MVPKEAALTKTPYPINATNTFQNQDHDLDHHRIKSTQEHQYQYERMKEMDTKLNDQLALEISHRRMTIGKDDIDHKFEDPGSSYPLQPHHIIHNPKEIENEDEESEPETGTSDSDTDQEGDNETSEDSEQGSASD